MNVKISPKNLPIYKTIEDGFMKLDFELIKNKNNP